MADFQVSVFLIHCYTTVEMGVLYGKQLRYDAKNPDWEERDMVVLSKGHSGPAWYSVLAEKGFFDREWLFTLNDGGTKLPSHPDRLKTPGVDMTTGSLGQGTSAAAGIATGFKMNKTDQYVYLIVGDGELNEGQCWEAFQYIAHYKLNHCVVIIDDNKKQLDGTTKEVMNPFSIENKMKAFGFYTQTVKGNDEEAIDEAINRAKNVKDQAVCIPLLPAQTYSCRARCPSGASPAAAFYFDQRSFPSYNNLIQRIVFSL